MVGMERSRSPKGALSIDLSHIDTVLKAGDQVGLTTALTDLQVAIQRIQMAQSAMDKVAEFENLRRAYEAVKRAEGTLTPIMFKFVG
jgi:hypothetical protein